MYTFVNITSTHNLNMSAASHVHYDSEDHKWQSQTDASDDNHGNNIQPLLHSEYHRNTFNKQFTHLISSSLILHQVMLNFRKYSRLHSAAMIT